MDTHRFTGTVRHRTFRVLVAVLSLALLSGCGGCGDDRAGETPDDRAAFTGRVRADIEFLASDALNGRLMGEPGIAEAERYIAAQFADMGLESLPGLQTMYHDFTVARTGFVREGVVLEIGEDGFTGEVGREFRPLPFSQAADVTGLLVFAGYGISASSWGHDDYAGLDVAGKIVVVLRGEPDTVDPASPFHGEGSTLHAYFKTKGEVASRRGAAGIIVVNLPTRPERPTDFTLFDSFELDDDKPAPAELSTRVAPGFAAVFASSSILEWVCREWELPVADLVAAMNESVAPETLGLPELPVRLAVQRYETRTGVPARNVVAVLPGSDPNRSIIIGAHHDHLGVTGPPEAGEDTIFNGADDNASGVAAVLELARQFNGTEIEPTLIFATFSGEEQGLLGSAALVSSGLIDSTSVDLMVNLDMAARNAGQPVLLYHGGNLPVSPQRLEEIAASIGLPVTIATEGVGGSDQLPFERSGIPVIFPFSGYHDDYHGIDDEVDRLEFDRLRAIVSFAREVVLDVAR